jgi:hypothetical protein
MATSEMAYDQAYYVLDKPDKLPERATAYIEGSYNRRFLLDCGAEGHDLWVRPMITIGHRGSE